MVWIISRSKSFFMGSWNSTGRSLLSAKWKWRWYNFKTHPVAFWLWKLLQGKHNQTTNQTISLRTWNPQPVLHLSILKLDLPISLLMEYFVNQLMYGSQYASSCTQSATILGPPTQTTTENPGAIKILHQAETRAYCLAFIWLTLIHFA